MMCWWILCVAGHLRGPAFESICVTCLKSYGRNKKLPIPMMTRHGNGVSGGEKQRSRWREITARAGKSPPVPAVEPLRAGHTYNRSASCPAATCGTVTCDESGCLAYVHMRPLQPIQAA